MAKNDNFISGEDVARLLKDPSADARAETAAKVSATFGEATLSPKEREMAEAIIRAMVQDAEVRVRKALAESIKDNPNLPNDVAVALANDVADVATPIIEFSTALSDQDLVDIIQSKPPEYQKAVARRIEVSEQVSEALVNTEDEEVVAELMGNEGAEISEATLNKVVDVFGDNARINEPLVHRGALPLSVSERLVSIVSESLKNHLVTHHEMSAGMATDLVLQTRERATVSLLGPGVDVVDLEDMISQLHENGRLTPTLILRALCMGDSGFFEMALAKLAGISVVNAFTLIHDDGKGLESLYQKCGLPDDMLPVFRVAVNVAEETHYDGEENDQERYRKRMIERILTHFEDGMDTDDLDFFIDKLGRGKPGHAAAN